MRRTKTRLGVRKIIADICSSCVCVWPGVSVIHPRGEISRGEMPETPVRGIGFRWYAAPLGKMCIPIREPQASSSFFFASARTRTGQKIRRLLGLFMTKVGGTVVLTELIFDGFARKSLINFCKVYCIREQHRFSEILNVICRMWEIR